jgi:hypothetical protein
MATRITDVIDPEVLSRIVIRTILNNIFRIPGVFDGNEFSEGDPGTFWEVIFGNKLGDFETYDPDTPLTAQKLTQGRFGHVVIRKAALYGVDKIVKKAAKQNPMDYFSIQLPDKILETLMLSTINVLEGAIPAASRIDNNAVISRAEINKAKYVLGDKASTLKWITMHSKIFQVLEDAGDIVYQPMGNILPLADPNQFMQVITNDQNFVATIAGLIIWQSDNVPVISGSPDEYVSYLTGDRAVGFYPQGALNIDTDRDITTKEDFISPDLDYVLSLWGTNYTGAPSYTDADLSNVANYTTVWDVKEIPATRLLSRIA